MFNRLQLGITILFTVLSIVVLSAFQNCSNNGLSSPVSFSEDSSLNYNSNPLSVPAVAPTPTPAEGTKSECQKSIETTVSKLKIAFLVDVSGSNVRGTDGSGINPTDPDRKFRYSRMVDFQNLYKNRSEISWQFVVFGDVGARVLLPSLDFTYSHDVLTDALNFFLKNPLDRGGTPYRAAFNALVALLSKDKEFMTGEANAAAILISDGAPTDYCPQSAGCPLSQIDTKAIKSDIDQIMGFAQNRLTINTVYYGPSNPDARRILASIATYGKGGFADVNDSSSEIQLSQVVKVTETCY